MRVCSKAMVAAALIALSAEAEGALTYSLEGVAGWPNQAHYDAAVAAIQSTVGRYNAYDDFNSINNHVFVYYDAGIPTAQASYGGSIGFGGTYPNERVTMHELAHFLGLPSSGWSSLMTGGTWDGARGVALVQQFDGLQATLNGDSIHFWPYGLNFDSEGSEINRQRQVAMVHAMRADLGIGPSAHPSTATTVTMTANNPSGESGFNYKGQWSDGYFAHAGASYFTGNFAMRTPASPFSFNFAGNALTLNNTNGDLGGLFYNGQGSTGILSFNNLVLDGGWIQHTNGIGDVFQLDGILNVLSNSNVRAKQGNISILADVSGAGSLTIHPTDTPAQDNRYVRLFSSNNNFVGSIENQGRFELADGANQKFVIGASGVSNAITGATAQATLINGVFEFDLSGASSNISDSWSIVSASNKSFGPTFSVAGFTEANNVWSNDAYEFSESTGMLTVLPAPSIWNVDGGGMWSSAGNWSGGVPVTDGRATLGPILTGPNAPATIQLDSAASLRRLTFDNANPYVISGANTLTLVGAAEIVANSGEHEVGVVIAGSAGLSVSGGKVKLSAANTYSGETRIHAGTLALSGAGTIANSPQINVTNSGALDVTAAAGGAYTLDNQTLTIDGNVLGNIIATNNSTVYVNSSNSMNGNLNAQSGSLVTGAGRIAGNLAAESGSVVQVGGQGLTFNNTRFLIDDFESYATGLVRDVASPPWTAHGGAPGTQFALVENDGGNKVLTYGWASDFRGTSRDIPEDGQIDNGETATFFFRFSSKTDDPDHNFGLSDNVDTTADANFGDYEAQFRIVQGASAGTVAVNARNGTVFTANLASGLALNTWYNVWMVVNQTTDTYDLYMNTGAADATGGNKLNTTPLAFRNGSTSEALDKILALAGPAPINSAVRYDTLTYLSNLDLRNPLGSTPPTFVGDSQSLVVEGDFIMSGSSILELDVVNASILDLIDVAGHFSASGALHVTLLQGAPAPQLGDVFDILDFSSSSGSFDTFQLPGLSSNLAWNVGSLLTTGELQVVQDVDFDDDGDVDGEDFLYIQRTNPSLIPAWDLLYGTQLVVPLTAAATAVPEPASLLFVLISGCGLALCRKGHK